MSSPLKYALRIYFRFYISSFEIIKKEEKEKMRKKTRNKIDNHEFESRNYVINCSYRHKNKRNEEIKTNPSRQVYREHAELWQRKKQRQTSKWKSKSQGAMNRAHRLGGNCVKSRQKVIIKQKKQKKKTKRIKGLK